MKNNNDSRIMDGKIKKIEENINDKKMVLLRGCNAELAAKLRLDIREFEIEIQILTQNQ